MKKLLTFYLFIAMFVYLAEKIYQINDQVCLAEFGLRGSQIEIFRTMYATKTDDKTAVLSNAIYVFEMNRNFPSKLFR